MNKIAFIKITMKRIWTFILLSSMFACDDKMGGYDLIAKTDSLFIPSDSVTLYFPDKPSSIDTSILSFESWSMSNRWYSNMLFSLKEPLLYNYPDSFTVCRFTWLRTKHNPVSVRIVKGKVSAFLILKTTNGLSGYKSGELNIDTSFQISGSEWNLLNERLDQMKFWEQRSLVDGGGKDGGDWILEIKDDYRYHFVVRWSPNEMRDKEFKGICEYLLSLSKLNIDPGGKY